jgi:hypothetical protein
MRFPEKQSNGSAASFEKLQESVHVGFGVFLFGATSVLGFSAIAWLLSLAMDPQHLPLKGALLVARFSVIPWVLTAGLATFFATVNWISKPIEVDQSKISAYRKLIATDKRYAAGRKRQAS